MLPPLAVPATEPSAALFPPVASAVADVEGGAVAVTSSGCYGSSVMLGVEVTRSTNPHPLTDPHSDTPSRTMVMASLVPRALPRMATTIGLPPPCRVLFTGLPRCDGKRVRAEERQNGGLRALGAIPDMEEAPFLAPMWPHGPPEAIFGVPDG